MDGWTENGDLVLPMTEAYEGPSSFQSIDRGIVYTPKLVEPQGESRDYNWFRMQFANGLGVGDQYAAKYFPGFQNVTYDKWDAAMLTLLQQNYQTWATSSATTAVLPNPPTWAQLQTNPIIRTDVTYPQAVLYATQIGGTKFGTPSGLIEFYDARLETFDASKIQGMGYYGLGEKVSPMPIWEVPEETYVDPKAAKYPLVMRDTHGRYTSGSSGWSNPMLRGEVYRHSVWMNPADAKARAIVDGNMVEVFNDRGTISVPAYVTSRQTPDRSSCMRILNGCQIRKWSIKAGAPTC